MTDPAATYDFNYVPGDSRPIVFRLKTESGSPFDLTGSWIKLDLSWPRGSLVKSSRPNEGLTVDNAAGVVAFAPTPKESRTFLSAKSARYRLKRIVTGGEERTLLVGAIRAFGV